MENTVKAEPTWWTIVRLLRWDKPAGRLILLVPALWGVCLGGRGNPPLPLVGVMILGTLATSALGCVANDLWDRDIDPHVERTKKRPLAERSLTVKTAFTTATIAAICAAVLAFYLNVLTFGLCCAAVPIILLYPAAKRVFPVPQLVLAIAWGLAVLISWTAVTGKLETAMYPLWLATLFWTLGFDTVYAMPDRDDDRRLGVNSSALFFGDKTPLAVGICFLLCAVGIGYTGYLLSLSYPFWVSLSIACTVWLTEFFRLNNPAKKPNLYGNIFRENVYLGFVILAGMWLSN